MHPHVTHASLGPPESTTQTASRSVQPFLHSSRQSVFGHVQAFSFPKNCFFAWRSRPMYTSTQRACRSVQPFLHSSRKSSGMPGHVLSPKNCPFALGFGSPIIRASWGPSESITQRASRLLQPFLSDRL